jgi:glyoxylase-like metal-dependent hydrolase (beta-lactamase superfamily II)
MLHYLTVPVTPFQQNASIVWCDATRQAAVIDPGGDLAENGNGQEKVRFRHGRILQSTAHSRLKIGALGPHSFSDNETYRLGNHQYGAF